MNNRQKRPTRKPFVMAVKGDNGKWKNIALSVRKNRALARWRRERNQYVETAFLTPEKPPRV